MLGLGRTKTLSALTTAVALVAFAGAASAQSGEAGIDAPVTRAEFESLSLLANNTWMLVAAVLVFIMHLGFAMLESGLTQAKNTVNILFKNVSIVGIGLLTYALCGFNLMYPGDAFAGGVFGFAGFGIGPGDGYDPVTYADGGYTYWTDFIFQGMFAATAATIVSGVVCGNAA